VWRLADQQRNALEIADRGGKLYDKFVGFVDDLLEIGRSLDGSQRLLAEAVKKLHSGPGNLVGQAEKLKNLGVKASKALPAHLVEGAESTGTPSLPSMAARRHNCLKPLEQAERRWPWPVAGIPSQPSASAPGDSPRPHVSGGPTHAQSRSTCFCMASSWRSIDSTSLN